LDAGATVRVTDPEAMDEARKEVHDWPNYDRVIFVDSAVEAAEGSDAIILITEWSEFRNPDFAQLGRVVRERVMYDGRNVLVPEVVREGGFEYHGVGRIPPS
jgi:UDPglucose 6-dehydrogenase